MVRHYIVAILITMYLLLPFAVSAKTLKADFRQRPPEMVVDSKTNQLSGPLKEVIEQAAAQIGYNIEWRKVPFIRSLYNLKNNETDIVPRVIKTPEREQYIRYIGPIAVQNHDVEFITTVSGPKIETYNDLLPLRIGVKRGTAYFQRFDADKSLIKIIVKDDFNLARMLKAERIDTAAVIDFSSFLSELNVIHFTEIQKANYVYPNKIGNYYGMPLNSPVAQQLNQVLLEMVENGNIDAIYHKYGITPDITDK